jgi:hypothetical protein
MSRNYVTAVRVDVSKLAALADYYLEQDIPVASAASVISQVLEDFHLLLSTRKELKTRYMTEDAFSRIGALFGHTKKTQDHVLQLAKSIGEETVHEVNNSTMDLLSGIKADLGEEEGA